MLIKKKGTQIIFMIYLINLVPNFNPEKTKCCQHNYENAE